ncbi:MAG: hypothetical protein HS116_18990 [Planctomycetes bacterium]|nr:hypothetical protein [Planctomycetota bacterium]
METKPVVIEAHAFILKDAAGRQRASLDARGDQCGLRLYDERGRLGLLASVNEDGAHLLIQDARSEGALQVAACMGAARISLSDSSGRVRAVLCMPAKGIPLLEIHDAKGRYSGALWLNLDGAPVLIGKDEAMPLPPRAAAGKWERIKQAWARLWRIAEPA